MTVIGIVQKHTRTRMRLPCDWLPTSGRWAPGHWRGKPPRSAAQSVSFWSSSWTPDCSELRWCWEKTCCPRGPSVRLSAGPLSSYVKHPGVSCWAAADVNASCSGRSAAAGAGKLSAMHFYFTVCFDIYRSHSEFIGVVDCADAESSQTCRMFKIDLIEEQMAGFNLYPLC